MKLHYFIAILMLMTLPRSNTFFLFKNTGIKAVVAWLIVVFSFSNPSGFCQNKTQLDSLKKAISIKGNSLAKANAYNQLARAHYNLNIDSAIVYANRSVWYASNNKYYEPLAKAYNYLGQFAYAKGNYQLSLSSFEKFRATSILAKNEVYEIQAINNIANVYIDRGKTEEAIKNYEEALKLSIAKNFKKEMALAYSNLAYAYRYIGDYNRTIKYLFEQIKINEELKYELGLANGYQQLALIYTEKGDYKNAKQYLDLSIQKFEAGDDPRSVAISYDLISNYFFKQHQYDNAIANSKKAIGMATELKDKRSLATFQDNLAEIYFYSGKYDEAKVSYLKAIDLHNEIGLQKTSALSYIGYGKSLLRLNELQQAKNYLEKGLELAKNHKSAFGRKSAYEALTEYYIKTNQAELALNAQKMFNDVKDSLLNESNNKSLNELNTIYRTEKKQEQINLLSKENAIKALAMKNDRLIINQNNILITQQEQKLLINDLELQNKNQIVANQKLDAEKKNQNIKALEKQTQIQDLELSNQKLKVDQRNLAIGLILVLFIAAGGFAYSYYNRNQLKQQGQLQAEIYKQQEIATKSVFEGEQNERIRIARDLHDSIGQMLSVVKMNVSTLDEKNAVVTGTMQLVDKTIEEVRHISHNLIPEALNFGLFSALQDSCDKINVSGKTQVSLSIADELQSLQLSKQNELSIYRIVQEVLNNMVKHANAANIDIDITKPERNLVINIRDNGQGFDTSKIDESRGIGWKNISARVHLMDGQMKIESEKLVGTKIEISIPG